MTEQVLLLDASEKYRIVGLSDGHRVQALLKPIILRGPPDGLLRDQVRRWCIAIRETDPLFTELFL